MEENTVYIGKKPVMVYCTAVLRVLSGHGSVKLVARGRAISHAVYVAEITRNQLLTDLSVDSVEIGTEELKTDKGEVRNVSSIAITLSREEPSMEDEGNQGEEEDGSEEETGVHVASASGVKGEARASPSPVPLSEVRNTDYRCPGCGATKDYTRTEDEGLHWRCSLCGHAWGVRVE